MSWEELRSVEEWKDVERISMATLLITLMLLTLSMNYLASVQFIYPEDIEVVREWIQWMSFCFQTCRIRVLAPYLMFLCLPVILPAVYVCEKMLTIVWYKGYKLTVEAIE